jgi:hypothetical protein
MKAWPPILVAALLVGCAHDPVVSLNASQALDADDYDDTLDRWTRSDEIFNKLYSVMFLHGTFHSPEFRRAFLVRHPNVYGPGSEEANRLMLTKPEGEVEHEFFLAVSTPTRAWNDLGQNDSVWRVTVQGDDGELVEAKVERVKTSANLRAIYPYITDYARTYAVHVPLSSASGAPVLTPQTKKLTLKVASALGDAILVWQFKP